MIIGPYIQDFLKWHEKSDDERFANMVKNEIITLTLELESEIEVASRDISAAFSKEEAKGREVTRNLLKDLQYKIGDFRIALGGPR